MAVYLPAGRQVIYLTGKIGQLHGITLDCPISFYQHAIAAVKELKRAILMQRQGSRRSAILAHKVVGQIC